MSISLCYITPSFRGDIERFALLRRSLRLFSPTIPHLVYVDTEDCRLFRQRFGAEPNLTIVPTAEILPPAVERQRRFWRGRRGWVAERIGWRLGLYRRFSGWKLQQLIKLEALARLPAEAGIFLDSDIFLCGPVDETEFVTAAGELRLLETPAETYWDFGFEVGRQLVLGRPLGERMEGFNYIHQAPRFLRRTAARLIETLQAHGENWRDRLFREPFLSEYNLLGYTARVLEGYRGYRREPGPSDRWTYEVKEAGALAVQLAQCRAEGGRRKFFLVQSNLRLPSSAYIPEALALIEQLAATSASSQDPARLQPTPSRHSDRAGPTG